MAKGNKGFSSLLTDSLDEEIEEGGGGPCAEHHGEPE